MLALCLDNPSLEDFHTEIGKNEVGNDAKLDNSKTGKAKKIDAVENVEGKTHTL